jgi:hypothetical protein
MFLFQVIFNVNVQTFWKRGSDPHIYRWISLCQNSAMSKFRLPQFFFQIPNKFQCISIDLIPFFSKFDMSKFRLSRSNFSVPKVKINTNHVIEKLLLITIAIKMMKMDKKEPIAYLWLTLSFQHSDSKLFLPIVLVISQITAYSSIPWLTTEKEIHIVSQFLVVASAIDYFQLFFSSKWSLICYSLLCGNTYMTVWFP